MDDRRGRPSRGRDEDEDEGVDAHVDASARDIEALDPDRSDGNASSEHASDLPDEFDDYVELVQERGLDEDERALEEKERYLEQRTETTDADEEGIEANIKRLDFEDDDEQGQR
ncbi:hypothetical protein [Halotalea alkalilenta]|uniref:hypothetical protein n=1 Tax=Halotalea alkalilenta TaxID=376489 RepID=UPI00048559A1|nr:hypothetical protein [Halotalea alkalilenta]